MGQYIFNLPDIGEGIAEAEIVAWHIKPGDRIEEDDKIADVMTDKATVEMESPVSGIVLSVAGEAGDVIAIGSALVVIETEGDDGSDSAQAEPLEASSPIAHPSTSSGRAEIMTVQAEPVEAVSRAAQAQPAQAQPAEAQPAEAQPAQAEPAEAPASNAVKILASPAVRQRARDLGIDLAQVKPSEAGRIRHADLDGFISYNAGFSGASASKARADETIKVIGMRRRIAENMAASKRHIPHFSYVEECDVTALEAMRADLNANRGADRPKLTMLPLLITAICKALPHFPMINARYDDDNGVVTRHGAVHLGMATQTDAGLMVPVIRNAQLQNIWQLAREITRLAQAARDGSAKSDELSGSTLTVTSLGPLGGVATTPVINRPEVAIIGPNRIVERPMFVRGADGVERVEKRRLMNISISCDHRVVDGWDAASFVQAIRKLVETPVLLFAD